MSPYQSYLITPQQHGLDVSAPAINAPFPFGYWGSLNFRVGQRSLQKPWGYETADRSNLGTLHQIILFQLTGGTRHTCYLNTTDFMAKETTGSNTWSYKTDTGDYDDSVASISTTAVTFKASTVADSEDIVAGDYFILDTDHSSQIEPDTNWALISAVATAGGYFTGLTLSASYTGTTGSWGGSDKDCLVRRVYTTPTNERMAYCILRNRLIFTNGNIPVQSWTGSGYASALNSTSAIKARNCIAYANRLIIADHGTTRDPVGLAWSINGDATDWTGTGSGSVTFLDADDFITALGVVGVNIVIYRRDSLLVGYQTGVATPALSFPLPRKGIGCVSPYSIVEANNTNYFVGTNDFYVMDGDMPISIGERIRDKFFDIVAPTELEKVVGYENTILNEILWLANTSEGKFVFAYDYKRKEWNLYQYGNQDVISFGKGAK